jgi:hypothetical protein
MALPDHLNDGVDVRALLALHSNSSLSGHGLENTTKVQCTCGFRQAPRY